MRADALGFWWNDLPAKRKLGTAKPKRTPPDRTWESEDYLPGLEEAKNYQIPLLTEEEVIRASAYQDHLIVDCEVYGNYFLAEFKSVQTGKYIYFERKDLELTTANDDMLRWILENCITVGFNSLHYDLTILALVLEGKSNITLKAASDLMIKNGMRSWEVLRAYKAKQLSCNHIDLMNVAPLAGSLKAYAGRCHAPKMQDLPFPPDRKLTPDQQLITRHYCKNDLDSTHLLFSHLSKQLELRKKLSETYKVDLRSKSDAQIAEALLAQEVGQLLGVKIEKPESKKGTEYRYHKPKFMEFETEYLNTILDKVTTTNFIVNEFGRIGLPEAIGDLEIKIGEAEYTMGIGGLHSNEEKCHHESDANYFIVDRDVTSYYPFIILNQQLFPEHLGPAFIKVFKTLVDRRLAAKKAGNKEESDSLKIAINGTFGKLGSPWSKLYSPNLLIQTTITGQLALLMLIEKVETNGMQVLSANTDGITIKCRHENKHTYERVIKEWEEQTSFKTEEVVYKGIYSRDVNNYFAIKEDGGIKGKGIFLNPWDDKNLHSFELHKNPVNTICVKAVISYVKDGIPIHETIRSSKDFRQFLTVRAVKGGAVKNGEYYGKTIRWYYAEHEEGEIIYAKSGNKVPRSDGAKPCMVLPENLPTDINYDWYIEEAQKLLHEVGLE